MKHPNLGIASGRSVDLCHHGVLAAGLACALLLAAGPVVAAALVDSGGSAEPGRRQVVAAPTTGAVAATLELVAGRIEAVDPSAGTVTLRREVLQLHPAVKVLGPSGLSLGGARALRRGMVVRVAFESPSTVTAGADAAAASRAAASAAAHAARRIVLIYVDAAP